MNYSARYAKANTFVEYIKVGGSYQVVADYWFQTSLRPSKNIITPRLHLLSDGRMFILEGYCWDGVTGAIDRKTNMRAGCSHDGLSQLSRMRLIPFQWWPKLDDEFRRILEKDGAWKITQKIDMLVLKILKGKYAHPDSRKKRYRTR